jgi:nicotinate-nucleotide--dimethylbenzimidazole phosphoribosyltransferase
MDADLRVYEMDLETPTRDRRHEPAMSEDEMVRAMSYGMMAIAPDADIYAMGAFGAGSRECAEALLDYEDTPLNLLQNRGGLEICALAGAVLATRLAGLPLLLEAPQGLGALHALGNHIPSIGQHCCVVYTGHNSQTLPAPAGKAQTLTIEDRLPQHPGIACAMGLNRVRALGPVIDAEHASEIDKQKQQSESCNDMREDT